MRVLLTTFELGLSLWEFDALLLHDSSFVRNFHSVRNDTDVSVTEWEKDDETWRRRIQFTTPFHAPAILKRYLGTSEARCTVEEWKTNAGGSNKVLFGSNLTFEGIFLADSIRNENKWEVVSTGERSCRVDIESEVEYTGSVWGIGSTIEKKMEGDMNESLMLWEKLARKRVAEVKAEEEAERKEKEMKELQRLKEERQHRAAIKKLSSASKGRARRILQDTEDQSSSSSDSENEIYYDTVSEGGGSDVEWPDSDYDRQVERAKQENRQIPPRTVQMMKSLRKDLSDVTDLFERAKSHSSYLAEEVSLKLQLRELKAQGKEEGGASSSSNLPAVSEFAAKAKELEADWEKVRLRVVREQKTMEREVDRLLETAKKIERMRRPSADARKKQVMFTDLITNPWTVVLGSVAVAAPLLYLFFRPRGGTGGKLSLWERVTSHHMNPVDCKNKSCLSAENVHLLSWMKEVVASFFGKTTTTSSKFY